MLQLLQGQEAAVTAVRGDASCAARLHRALYNHAVATFEGQAFGRAAACFAAALDFASASATKAQVCRVLATCHLLGQRHGQATNYCQLAGEGCSWGSGAVPACTLELLARPDGAAAQSVSSHVLLPLLLRAACRGLQAAHRGHELPALQAASAAGTCVRCKQWPCWRMLASLGGGP